MKRNRLVLCLGMGLLLAGAWLARGAPPEAPDWIPLTGLPVSISATEITVAQFGACEAAGVCALEAPEHCNGSREDRADHPINCVDFAAAQTYCTWAGGRLCVEAEWLAACSGAEGRAFPYGETFEPDACNASPTPDAGSSSDYTTAPAGSHAGCGGGLPGLWDMAGNVWEWVDACQDDYCKFRGGAYITNEPVERFAGCGLPCSGNLRSARLATVGIRCCRDSVEP